MLDLSSRQGGAGNGTALVRLAAVRRTRQLIPAGSVQNLRPSSAASKAYAGSACGWATGLLPIRAARCC